MTASDARNRLLNAAGSIFAAKGYRASTVREICDRADVNLASINYHFGDKQRLYIETVKRAYQLKADQVSMPEWPTETPPTVKLADFIRTLLTRMIGVEEDSWQHELIMREIVSPTSACRELVLESFRPQFDLLLEILDELLPSETPDHTRHQLAFSVVGQCLNYRVAGEVVSLLISEEERKAHYSPHQLAGHIAQFCLAAFGAAPAYGKEAAGGFVSQERRSTA